MKKFVFMLVVAVLAVACQSTASDSGKAVSNTETVVATTYKGTLPAADCSGIEYELTLNAESLVDIFSLNMTYLEGGENGADESFNVRGRISHINRNGKKVLRLQPVDGGSAMYFMQINDSTLRLVNEELEENTSGLNYDLLKTE